MRLPVLTFATAFVACGPSADPDDTDLLDTDPGALFVPSPADLPQAPTYAPLPGAAAAGLSALHPLVVLVTVETPVPTRLRITTDGPGVTAREHRVDAPATQHRVVLAGHRASQTYDIAIHMSADDGRSRTVRQRVTTGPLPFDPLPVTVLRPDPNAGITLLATRDPSAGPGVPRPVYAAIDGEGHVVWFYRDLTQTGQAPLLRRAPDGRHLFATFPTEARLLDLEGQVVRTWRQAAPEDGWHHDRRLMRDGNLVVLGSERMAVGDGDTLLGDVGIELTPEGAEVQRWSSFATLPTDRFPGPLSLQLLRGEIDWTHSNGVGETHDGKGYYVSVRHQHWIVRVNRATAELDWIFGDGGDFTLTTGTWFNSPHAPLAVGDDELLVYDNGTERAQLGGLRESRVVRYRLDESAMTAEQTWSWTIPHFTPIVGSVSPYGDQIFVNAGGRIDLKASFYLVDPDGTVTWEAEVGGLVFQAEMIERL